mgnify:CR=1 FL=1
MKYTTLKLFTLFCIILLCLIMCSSVKAQDNNFCDDEICVVQFNAGWNEVNGVEWLSKLTDCGITTIIIDENKITQTHQKDYGIVVVPTIIVFNGKEVKRFQADLSFKMLATKEDVQEIIDEIIMKKF